MSDPRKRVDALVARALGSTFEEEQRTSALAAVRLIEKHGMLAGPPSPPPRARSIQSDYDARAEIEALREQVALLRNERRIAASPPRPKLPPPSGYTTSALIDLSAHLREIDTLRREVARLQSAPRSAPAFYIVRPGDTPTLIAETYTGDGTRFQELVMSNPQKSSYATPGGARTFTSLVVGERLQLPAGWGR